MDINELYEIYLRHPVICTDSRNIEKGSIFFSLNGANFNGNSFSEKALESGAAFAIIDEEFYKKDDRYILVNNVLETLQKIAAYHRKQLNIPFLGITGTNGKTTTKELILSILNKKYKTAATKGNLNNHIGVPLTILSIKKSDEIAVIEMGANHIGEIAELCEICDPDYGIITNIGKAHLEGFKNIENIVKTKTALYKYIEKKNGKVFVNSENNLLMSLSEKNDRITYGVYNNCYLRGEIVDMSPYINLSWSDKHENLIKTQLFGKYNFENILAAICVGKFFNVDENLISEAISEYKPANFRSQIEFTEKNTLVLDAYNSNPTSLSTSIESFSDISNDIKVVIIGDMLELGENEEKEHLEILNLIHKKSFSRVFLVGKIFTKINNNSDYVCFKTSEDARNYFLKEKILDSLILIKGSRGIQLEKIIDVL